MALNTNRISGRATATATQAYQARYAEHLGKGHFSEFLDSGIRLSSLGLGTFPGRPDTETDAVVAQVVGALLMQGVNVVDTASHYRYGHALAAVGVGVRQALAQGVSREALFIVSKGGFLSLRGGPPPDFDRWFEREILAQGLGVREQLTNKSHLLSPEYIDYQINLSRHLMGLQTLDAFLVDQPEIHVPQMGKERMHQQLLEVFVTLEQAVADGRIGCYGLSSFYAFRVETDHPLFMSLTSLLALASKAAQRVQGREGSHHCRIIQLPFNQGQLEGFSRFNQATGIDNVVSTLQAAYQLGLYVMASHTLMKGRLATEVLDVVAQSMPSDLSAAGCAMQFNRSTPGLGTTLVGISAESHLQDLLTVAALPIMEKKAYLAMYQRA